MSGLLSPSRSPIAIENGFVSVVKSTLAANELVVMLPLILVLRNIEMLFDPILTTVNSGLPSPSKSLITGEYAPFAEKFTLGANELVVMLP